MVVSGPSTIGLSRILRGIPEHILRQPEIDGMVGEPAHESDHPSMPDDFVAQRELITMVEFELSDTERDVYTPLRVFFSAPGRIPDDDLLTCARAQLADALERAARMLKTP